VEDEEGEGKRGQAVLILETLKLEWILGDVYTVCDHFMDDAPTRAAAGLPVLYDRIF
jgi:hypothetical protein